MHGLAEQGVGEADRQQVLDGVLPEIVVHAAEPLLGEVLAELHLQCARRLEVVAERLLHDQSGLVGESRFREACGGLGVQPRRDGQVVHEETAPARLLGNRAEADGLVVVDAGHVQQIGEACEGVLVDLAVGRDRVVHVFAQMLDGPVAAGDAHDGHVQRLFADEFVERGQQHLLGEIPGDAE